MSIFVPVPEAHLLMGFYVTTRSASATPKTHTRRFPRTPKTAYRRSRVEGPGLRFYSPGIGRWLSRDPIEEKGGLGIYLFGIIGMQGVALIQSEKVNLFDPKQLAVGAIILICGIGGNLAMPNGVFPFNVPYLFPNGIPAIVFAAIIGIFVNSIFLIFKAPEVRGG